MSLFRTTRAHAGAGELAAVVASGAKRVQPDWKLVLGESAVDICLLKVAASALPSTTSSASSGAAATAGRRDASGGGGGFGGGAQQAQRAQRAQQELLVVGEHSLFAVSAASGQLLLQRRLEYHPACCRAYGVPPPGAAGAAAGDTGDGLLVATHTKALLVYQGSSLVWAAGLELQPVALRVVELGGVKGMIVALDDAGASSRCTCFHAATNYQG